MSNSFESIDSVDTSAQVREPRGWVKVGVVAATTAFAGGLLAVWWYRQTIAKLREAEENANNPQFGIPEDHPSDET
jgi:hypothetical protein